MMGICLPKGWRVYDFDEVASIASGQVDPKSEEFSGLPLVGSDSLSSGGGLLVGKIGTAKAAGAISGKYLFEPRQVIYSKIRPNLNKVWLSTFSGLCSADIYSITFDDAKLIPEYAYYCMLSDQFRKIAVSASMRSGIPKVNRDDLSAVMFRVPCVDEQRRIVAVLDACDRAGALAEQVVDSAQELYRAAVRKTVVRGVQPATSFHLMKAKHATQTGWKRHAIADIAKEVRRFNRDGAALPVLSSTKLHGIVFSDEYFGKQVYSTDTSTYKRVRHGEFVYATNHIEEGSIGLQDICEEGLVSPMYTVFAVDDAKADPAFLFALFKTETYRQIFQANTSASVDRRGSLRWNGFSKLPVFLPSLEAQHQVVEALSTVQRQINLKSQRLRALRNQKRGLMQKLLTGEWRLTRDVPESEAADAGA